MKRLLLSLVLVVFFCAASEAQDFEVRNFRENITDLSAAMAGIKDRNNKDAALLRFAVRDGRFEFEPNLGTLKQESKTGEVRLYVPEGTKRITIRHPQLGILRDFALPVTLVAKTTYDAEIVITNKEYLQAIFGVGGYEIPPVDQTEDSLLVAEIVEPQYPEVEDSDADISEEKDSVIELPVIADTLPTVPSVPQPIKEHSTTDNNLYVYAGIGFNAVSVMGPSVHLGLGYKALCLEAGYVLGLDKVEGITFTPRGSSSPSESYDYSCSKFWVRLGIATNRNSRFQVMPQAGVSFNMIKGKSLLNSSGGQKYFNESQPMSVFGALRFSYKATEGLSFHLTPQYDFAMSGDAVYEVIKTADGKIKAWGEGFGVNVGLLYQF